MENLPPLALPASIAVGTLMLIAQTPALAVPAPSQYVPQAVQASSFVDQFGIQDISFQTATTTILWRIPADAPQL